MAGEPGPGDETGGDGGTPGTRGAVPRCRSEALPQQLFVESEVLSPLPPRRREDDLGGQGARLGGSQNALAARGERQTRSVSDDEGPVVHEAPLGALPEEVSVTPPTRREISAETPLPTNEGGRG
jgi:hypothetical protein